MADVCQKSRFHTITFLCLITGINQCHLDFLLFVNTHRCAYDNLRSTFSIAFVNDSICFTPSGIIPYWGTSLILFVHLIGTSLNQIRHAFSNTLFVFR